MKAKQTSTLFFKFEAALLGCLDALVEQMLISFLPVNLALSFARRGIKAGILDTDIFGPSIPTLLNLSGEPRLDESKLAPARHINAMATSTHKLPQTTVLYLSQTMG